MTEFNSCAGLVNDADLKEVDQLRADSPKDILQTMLDMQRRLQSELATRLPKHNKNPDELKTCGDILDWMRRQNDAIDDERRELFTSLGGMSNGEKSATAVWKAWKADHDEKRNTLFADLSEEDRLEVLFEMIDEWHFVLNKFLALGMTSDDIFALYALKNRENFKRYENNY